MPTPESSLTRHYTGRCSRITNGQFRLARRMIAVVQTVGLIAQRVRRASGIYPRKHVSQLLTKCNGVSRHRAWALAIMSMDQGRERGRLRDGHDCLERQRSAMGVVATRDAADRVA